MERPKLESTPASPPLRVSPPPSALEEGFEAHLILQRHAPDTPGQRADAWKMTTHAHVDDHVYVRLTEAIALDPHNPELLQALSGYYLQKGALFSAENCWAKICRILPERGLALAIWGGLLLRTGQTDKAREIVPRAYTLAPEYLPARYNLLCLHAQQYELGRMTPILNNLFANEASSLMEILSNESRLIVTILDEPAVQVLAASLMTGIARTPSPPRTSIRQVDTLMLGREPTAADPPNPSPIEERADLLRKTLSPILTPLQSAREAVSRLDWIAFRAAMQQAIDNGATAPYFQAEIASALHSGGKLEEAHTLIEELAERNPASAGVLFIKAEIVMAMGRYLEAERILESIIRSKPRDPVVLFVLACAQAQQGYEERALKNLLLSVDIQPAVLRQALTRDQPYSQVIRTSPAFESLRSRVKQTDSAL